METFNLQEIQEMTCIAISKQDWVKNIIQQIKDAAAKGETECEINLIGTPAENIDENYMRLVFFLSKQGFKVNENVKDTIVVRWDFPNPYEEDPIEEIKTAILHLTEVQCNMTKAICTGDEEEKRLISEEMDVIIGNLPEY